MGELLSDETAKLPGPTPLLPWVLGIVIASAFAACSKPIPDDKQQSQLDEVTWTRSRQCADHASQLTKRFEDRRARDNREPLVLHWQNHYSSKASRCYVTVAFFNPMARDAGGVVPQDHRQLFDAIENLEIASHTHYTLKDNWIDSYCYTTDAGGKRTSRGDCATANSYIEAKMKE